MPIPMFNSIGGDCVVDGVGSLGFLRFTRRCFFLFGTHSLSSMCWPASHADDLWQSGPSVPVGHTHTPSLMIFGRGQTCGVLPPDEHEVPSLTGTVPGGQPSCSGGHWPFTGILSSGQRSCGGVGQLPSLLRGTPPGQPDDEGGGDGVGHTPFTGEVRSGQNGSTVTHEALLPGVSSVLASRVPQFWMPLLDGSMTEKFSVIDAPGTNVVFGKEH